MRHFIAILLLAYLSLMICDTADAGDPLPLGIAQLVSGPTACSGFNCYTLTVGCPFVSENRNVDLRVGDHSGTYKGTITFHSVLGGTSYYSAKKVISDLRAAGYKTVEVRWQQDWYDGAPNQLEGQVKLACRPATIIKWVYDNLHVSKNGTAFCATGHSGGAAQVAYPLSHYGLDTILSAVAPSGGPPMSRIDIGCDPSSPYPHFDPTAADIMDSGFGFSTNTGPCYSGDTSFLSNFQANSIAFGDQDFYHPNTAINIIIGQKDDPLWHSQSDFYLQRLQAASSPLIQKTIVPRVGHQVPDSPAGATAIVSFLKTECRPH